MCHAFSCILHKTKGVLRPLSSANKNTLRDHSHTTIIFDHKLTRTRDTTAAKRSWIRIEVCPANGSKKLADWKDTVDANFKIRIDEVSTPVWFNDASHRSLILTAMRKWIADGEALVLQRAPVNKEIEEIAKLTATLSAAINALNLRKNDVLNKSWQIPTDVATACNFNV